jgi:tryptophan-rich sensory protein
MRFSRFLDPETYVPFFEAGQKLMNSEKQEVSNKEGANHKQLLKEETAKLGEGEPNYFEALTSFKFLWKFIFVIALLVISVLLTLNVTLNNNVDSWYYNLYKPDWAPDGITIVIIYSFLSLLYIWCWYSVSKTAKSSTIDLIFMGFYVLNTVWFIVLFQYQNLETARILMDVIVGYGSILLIYTFFYLKIGSVSLYLLLFLGWSVLMIFYSYRLQDLSKEYSILGIVKDKSSTLYKKKVRLETVNGIKITETGEKIEFNPDDQE